MYIIEGNIGVGKSTLLKLLKLELPQISISLEPMHNWQQEVYGQSLLVNFYQNPKRWAYTLETLAMMCRIREHLQEQESPNIYKIVERSIYSGHYCFVKNSYESGFFTDLEWSLYTAWFSFLTSGKCVPPQGFIYLNADSVTALDRIKKRNRPAEKKITLHYLKQLEKRHEQFLVQQHDILLELKKVPVLTLDCNNEFETNKKQLDQHISNIERFITKNARPSLKLAI